jgi:hypothetical protein
MYIFFGGGVLLMQYDKFVSLGKVIPIQIVRVPGGLGCQISRNSVHEGVKVVRPTHRTPLPPRNYSWYSLPLEA